MWAYTDYDPMPPEPAVISVSAEPDYLVTIAWRSVASASRYELQYRYGYEEGKTYGIKTNKTSCTVDRIKGNLYFRLRYLYKNGKQYSEYTEWKTYYIEPLFLDVSGVESCDLIEADYWLGDHQLKGVAFEKRDWRDKSPQSFMFRGKKVDIYCYDFVVVFEDKRFEYEKQHDNKMELQSGKRARRRLHRRHSICRAADSRAKRQMDNLLQALDLRKLPWGAKELQQRDT